MWTLLINCWKEKDFNGNDFEERGNWFLIMRDKF